MTEITLILSALSLVLLGLVTVLLVKLSRSDKTSGEEAQLSLQLTSSILAASNILSIVSRGIIIV